MNPIDIPTIERAARAMRAQEIQRLQGLFSERLSLYAVLLGNSLLTLVVTLGEFIRPLLSWNPQVATHSNEPKLIVRLNRAALSLFSWNPQRKRSC